MGGSLEQQRTSHTLLLPCAQISRARWGMTGVRLCSGHPSGVAITCVPLCPQSQGAAWTLANPSCKLEQVDEVWPHLQQLLSPLCLPVVPEAFKASSSVEHSAPCPGAREHTNLTGAAGLDWSGKVPRASSKSCPAAEGSLFSGS